MYVVFFHQEQNVPLLIHVLPSYSKTLGIWMGYKTYENEKHKY